MMWQVGFTSGIEQGVALFIAFLIAVILHEVAHGLVALKLGDPTAKFAGRLTLNPMAHIDMMGTVIVPILLWISQIGVIFGWAKPVPVNYYNLRYGKWGPVWVALAGPATNLIILIIASLLARFSPADTQLPAFFLVIAIINGVLMLFNLLPIPPLDGSKVLNLFLEDRPDIMQAIERYGFFILLAVIFFGGRLLMNFVFLPALQLTSFFSGTPMVEIIQLLG